MASVSTSRPRAGILMMLLGIAVFSLSDAAGKHLAARLPIPEILLIRSIVALLVLAPLLARLKRAAFRPVRPGPQLLRMVLSNAEAVLYYFAIRQMPLADALTYYLAGPIVASALAVAFLGERLTLLRALSLGLGFAGVLAALAPGSAAFSPWALCGASGCLAFAVLMVVTRAVRETPASILLAVPNVGTLVLGAVFAPLHWVPPTGSELVVLVFTGICVMAGYAFVNRALALAEASVVMPYQYTLILWATLFGYVFFGQLPSARVVAGAATIIVAGLLVLRAETMPDGTERAYLDEDLKRECT